MDIIELEAILKKAIEDFGSDTGYAYDLGMSRIVGELFGEKNTVESARTILKTYANSQDNNKKNIAYAAFYCLNYHYRHQFNSAELNNLWCLYANSFMKYYDPHNLECFKHLPEFKSLAHLEDLRFLDTINLSNNFEEQLKYLEFSKSIIDIDEYSKKNAGYHHAFASLYISIFEKNEHNIELINKLKNTGADEYAIKAVKKGIDLSPSSAVFYCTLGRILSSEGENDKAEDKINVAISMEDSSRSDYALRINKYLYYRMLNQTRSQTQKLQSVLNNNNESINLLERKVVQESESVKNMQKQIKSSCATVKKMKDSLLSSIEAIGIFSGIVALVIGSLQIAINFSAFEAGLLILILMCGFTCALSSFSLILHGGNEKGEDGEKRKKMKNNVPVLIIFGSVLLLVLALLAIKYWV